MSKLQFTIDLKSFIVGIFSCLSLVLLFSFNSVSEDQIGRYQAVTGEHGHLILDTSTGEYLREKALGFRLKYGSFNQDKAKIIDEN